MLTSYFFKLRSGYVLTDFCYKADETLTAVSPLEINNLICYIRQINRVALGFDRVTIDDALSINGYAMISIQELSKYDSVKEAVNKGLNNHLLPEVFGGAVLLTNIVNGGQEDLDEVLDTLHDIKQRLFKHASIFPHPAVAMGYDSDTSAMKIVQFATGIYNPDVVGRQDDQNSLQLWLHLVGKRFFQTFLSLGLSAETACDIYVKQMRQGIVEAIRIKGCKPSLDDDVKRLIEERLMQLSPLPVMAEKDFHSEMILLGKPPKKYTPDFAVARRRLIEVSEDVYQDILELLDEDANNHSAVIRKLIRAYYQGQEERWRSLTEYF